jgi:AcrR family transcriptional regulator
MPAKTASPDVAATEPRAHDVEPPKRPGLTRERVIEAAFALADREGVEGLTMRSLAAQIGVKAMSLYHHIRNKDDLLDAMVDALAARIERPRLDGEWREQMRRRALSMRAVFQAHPWAPPVFIGRIALGPHVLALVDATIGCLRAAGFSYPDADHVWNAIDSHTYGFHVIERHFPVAPSAYQETASAYLPTLSADSYPHLHALGALVATGAYDGINPFEFGLDALLETFERRRQAALGAADSVSKA